MLEIVYEALEQCAELLTLDRIPGFKHILQMLATHKVGAGGKIASLLCGRHEHHRPVCRAWLAADQFGVVQSVELPTDRSHIHLRDASKRGDRDFINGADRPDHLHSLLRERQPGCINQRVRHPAACKQALELAEGLRYSIVGFAGLVDAVTVL